MTRLVIRRYDRRDEQGVYDVCYRTGFMGDTLEGSRRFTDRKLFAYLFCAYYLHSEPENCFVLYDEGKERVAGYIIGTLDSSTQARRAFKVLVPLVIGHVLTNTLWQHPSCLIPLMTFARSARKLPTIKRLYEQYPSHLHINILQDYHGLGFGYRLLEAFEQHLLSRNVEGVHLRTTSRNEKALKLYERNGYSVLGVSAVTMWPGELSNALLLGKRLGKGTHGL